MLFRACLSFLSILFTFDKMLTIDFVDLSIPVECLLCSWIGLGLCRGNKPMSVLLFLQELSWVSLIDGLVVAILNFSNFFVYYSDPLLKYIYLDKQPIQVIFCRTKWWSALKAYRDHHRQPGGKLLLSFVLKTSAKLLNHMEQFACSRVTAFFLFNDFFDTILHVDF